MEHAAACRPANENLRNNELSSLSHDSGNMVKS